MMKLKKSLQALVKRVNMRKKILYLFVVLSVLFIPNIVKAEEEINLYLFHSRDCGHCQAEREWLEELKNEYKHLNIHEYEVTRSAENSVLLNKIKTKFCSDTKLVPFTVIGEEYFVGWNINNETKILNEIKNK